MVSYLIYYAEMQSKNGKDFFTKYNQWFMNNCLSCPFFDEKESGICQAEYKLRILSGKKRSCIYIAIYYDKHYNFQNCLIKPIISHVSNHIWRTKLWKKRMEKILFFLEKYGA